MRLKYDFKRLRQTRIDRRLSLKTVGLLTGLSVGTVHNVETGKGASLNAIAKMERVLFGIGNGAKSLRVKDSKNGDSAA